VGLMVEVSLITKSLTVPVAAQLFAVSHLLLANAITSTLVTAMLFTTGFLVILNAAFVIVLRKKRLIEVLSFVIACLAELVIFVFLLTLNTHLLTSIPLNLPPGLPINRAEIGSTIALAIGLFPAAYWQHMSLSQMRQRMAEDAKVLKNRDGVRIRSNAPGEWLN
jgi:hypothetical protein